MSLDSRLPIAPATVRSHLQQRPSAAVLIEDMSLSLVMAG